MAVVRGGARVPGAVTVSAEPASARDPRRESPPLQLPRGFARRVGSAAAGSSGQGCRG